MSRTIRGSKGSGHEWRSKRPMSMFIEQSGNNCMRLQKRLCAKIERSQGKSEIKNQLKEID